jgi:hypothetical protein
MKVVTLHESNFRDPAATLRVIADQIEAGKFGKVGCVALAVLGDTLEVFGAGVDSEPPSVAMTLYAGFARLSKAIEEHGREYG